MCAAQKRQNESQYLVWSRKIQKEENYVQLYCLKKDDKNHRFFVLKFNELSDEKNDKELFTTYSQSARIATTKNEMIPISTVNIYGHGSSCPEIQYNVLKNCFTAGLVMVNTGIKHIITVQKGTLDIYICKQNGKYTKMSNSGRAIVNSSLLHDFLSPQAVFPGEPLQLHENYVYFFYTRDLASFKIQSMSMSAGYAPRSDVVFLFYMVSYVGPLEEQSMKAGGNDTRECEQGSSTRELEAELQSLRRENEKLKAIIRRVHQLTTDNL